MTPVSPSPQMQSLSPWSQRLVEQLQQLSEVTENLTYRLLDLEERVLASERELMQLREQAREGGELPEAMEGWLEDTEERLGRVEELLRGGAGTGRPQSSTAGRSLMAVAAPMAAEAEPEALDGDDPFPEEGEQPFLDEQIA